jgi:hypothetical protein
MARFYELLDLQSSNVVGTYDSVDAVLDDMSNAVREHGMEAVEGYILLLIDGEEQSAFAQPEELVDLVQKHMHALR